MWELISGNGSDEVITRDFYSLIQKKKTNRKEKDEKRGGNIEACTEALLLPPLSLSAFFFRTREWVIIELFP